MSFVDAFFISLFTLPMHYRIWNNGQCFTIFGDFTANGSTRHLRSLTVIYANRVSIIRRQKSNRFLIENSFNEAAVVSIGIFETMRQYQRKQFSVIFLEKALLKYSITLRYTLCGNINIIRVASFSTNLSRDTVAKDLYSLLQTLRENIHLSCRLPDCLSLTSLFCLSTFCMLTNLCARLSVCMYVRVCSYVCLSIIACLFGVASVFVDLT